MKKILYTTILFSILSTTCFSQTTTVYFNTNQAWNNTGYSYTAGTELFIYAFGAHADNPNNDNWVETPAGHNNIPTSGYPLNGVPENGLIGKIGSSGAPFYIGAGGKMVLSDNESGDLYLEVNDGDISNNVGELFVHILEAPTFTAYFNTNQTWNNTGYSYTAGTELFIYAFGAHADNPNNDNWVETPAGHNNIPTSGYPLNGVPENGLIGKIGPSGTPFYIGAGGKMVLSDNESGDLYLEVNDGDISNNVGELFIHIFDLSALSISENTDSNHTISIYPNPVLNNLTIVLSNPFKEKHTLNIINLNGQTVFNTNYNTEHLKIDLSKLLSGQYLISIIDSKGKILGTKKVVKE